MLEYFAGFTIWSIIYPVAQPILILVISYSFAFTILPEQLENIFKGYNKPYLFNWYDPLFFLAMIIGLYFFLPIILVAGIIYIEFSDISKYFIQINPATFPAKQ